MFLAAVAFASAIAATPAANAPADLAAALMRDPAVASCARESGEKPQAFVAHAFGLRAVTLRTGERMTVAEAVDPCLLLGQSTRIFILQRTGSGYRRGLESVAIPGDAVVSDDGTAVLPTHETMETIFESTYVWNGSTYAFSAPRSHVYDVVLAERRPYQVAVRFAPGATSAALAGSVALNFGQDYVFEGRAGQRATIDLTAFTGSRPTIVLYYGDEDDSIADLLHGRAWSGALPRAGTYRLTVYGSDASTADRVSTYAIRLTVR